MRVYTHTHTLTQESIHRVLSNTKDDLHRKLMSHMHECVWVKRLLQQCVN